MKGHAEFIRICSPVKRELRALDARVRQDFNRILNELIDELKRQDFRLRKISKRYSVKNRFQADSFWVGVRNLKPIQINFVCKLTTAFGGGFEILCDLDFFLEFPIVFQNFRSKANQFISPAVKAKNAIREELDRVWRSIEEDIVKEIIKLIPEGWGQHALPPDVVEPSLKLYHVGELTLTQSSSSDQISKLTEMQARALEFIQQARAEALKAGELSIQRNLPPPIETELEKAVLSVLAHNREGVAEYQIRRYLYTRYEARPELVIRTLQKLQVWNYLRIVPLPIHLRKKLEKLGIRKHTALCLPGDRKPPNFEPREEARPGLEPVTPRLVIQGLEAPEHLVNRALINLERRRIIQRIRTLNHLGEPIAALRIRKRARNLTGLELQILAAIANYYREQGKILDECRNAIAKGGMKNESPDNL